ncbi:hypothetical protein WN51_10874 [Melipona quadrifasciata]|uniref:Uncharacterized protein n=1 Tax=Melipona quadrifasciata TaxID=166423 RepID=A0A0N0BI70_9HYME|nr:hypothetical protein WN51_10874 [Melipona quadrifasciata]
MSYFPYVGGRGHLVTPPFLAKPLSYSPANVRLPPPSPPPPLVPSYPLWKTWFPIPFAPPSASTILTYPLQTKERHYHHSVNFFPS